MEEKNTYTNLFDIIELSKVPEGNLLLMHKIEELRHTYTEEIANHRQVVDKYKQQLYLDKKGTSIEYPPLYWYELSLFAPGDWGFTEHLIPAHVPYYELMPDTVLNHMAEVPVDADSVVTREIVFRAHGEVTRIFVEYVRLSATHIVGTVRRDEGPLADRPEWGKVLAKMEAGEVAPHRALYYLMHRYPVLVSLFMLEYVLRHGGLNVS
ncbi:MAG: hypothetical protein GY765_10590 [bacterium]|nr:hypothetical protein [bacterium]